MLLAGGKDMMTFDIRVDDSGLVLGTCGLYRYRRDAEEAVEE
jgi:hypothetical protein